MAKENRHGHLVDEDGGLAYDPDCAICHLLDHKTDDKEDDEGD